MTEMIERVAKAIIETMFAEHELPLEDEIYQKYLVTASAAIEAMRDPTEEMLERVARALCDLTRGQGGWDAMDTAATPPEGDARVRTGHSWRGGDRRGPQWVFHPYNSSRPPMGSPRGFWPPIGLP